MLDRLTRLVVAPHEADAPGVPHGDLTLRRAWPRAADHLLLEYVTGDGRIVAGQWFADSQRLQQVARKTARAAAAALAMYPQERGTAIAAPTAIVAGAVSGVLLQANGADRALPGLAPLLGCPAAALLAHRPDSRASPRSCVLTAQSRS
jgi:hypothetical protein